MNQLIYLAIPLILLMQYSIKADEPVSTASIETELLRYAEQSLDAWQFDAIQRDNNDFYHMRFLPIKNGEGKIQFLEINDKLPTEKEKKHFKKDHPPRKPKHLDEQDVSIDKMVAAGSIRFQSADNDIHTFTFTPLLAFDGEPSSEFPLKGIIEYDAEKKYIFGFYISSQTSFKPRFGMRVDRFDLKIRFTQHENGTVLVQNIHTEFSGKAFLLATVQKDTELTFFKYIAPQ